MKSYLSTVGTGMNIIALKYIKQVINCCFGHTTDGVSKMTLTEVWDVHQGDGQSCIQLKF